MSAPFLSLRNRSTSDQISDHFPCENQTCDRRNKGYRAGNRPAGRTLQKLPFRKRIVCRTIRGFQWCFRRIDYLQMRDAAFLQLLPHDPCKRTDCGLREIRHAKRRGIQFVAGAHGTDDWCPGLARLKNQLDLPCDSIDGIHYIVIVRETELFGGLRKIKGLNDWLTPTIEDKDRIIINLKM